MSNSATADAANRPFVLPREAIIALMRSADAARRAMTRALQPFDLTLPQFNVLTILLVLGELPTYEIAKHMVEATPGITRLVTTLNAKGYVRRSQSAGDRRQQLCSLTKEGRRIVESAIPSFLSTQKQLIRDLNRSEALQMIALLKRVPAPARRAARPAV
jgi:MarR family 2-MHQ and catechol resistance regulon transcriptional repressor